MSLTKNSITTAIKENLIGYFSLAGFLVPQEQAEQEIRDGVSFRGINILILITAIFIASLGLNTNSTAVIIGAMLISPLMGPIVGIGLGVGIQDFSLIKRSVRNLAMATIFSVLTSTLFFLISPVSEGHSELLARTSPTIYDVLIAFFGGAAGILAAGSRFKGNVIPGVAIATALMPPLCTAGYGIATWQLNYFFGAFYLFMINSVYIALATFIGVKVMQYHPIPTTMPHRARKVKRIVYTIAILVLLPSIYMTWSMLRQSNFQMKADRFVTQEFRFPATQVVSERATFDDGQPIITVTLIGRTLSTDSLRLAMQPRLQEYGLQGTHLEIIQGGQDSRTNVTDTSAKDIYLLAQSTITHQQATIDSLRAVNALRLASDTIATAIAPEIRVIFPEITQLGINTTVFDNIRTRHPDTMNIVMVKYARPMTPAQQKKFKQYLQARLNKPNITIVTL